MKKLLILLCLVGYWACSDDDVPQMIKPEVSFSEFTDSRDMKVYKCVTIGGQTWMAENLAYRMPDGSVSGCYTYGESKIDTSRIVVPISLFREAVNAAIARGEIEEFYTNYRGDNYAKDYLTWYLANGETASGVIFDFEQDYGTKFPETIVILNEIEAALKPAAIIEYAKSAYAEAEYRNNGYAAENGLLYTFEAAQLAVPAGWRIPTDADWKKLEETLGMPLSEIEKLDFWRGGEEGSVLKTGAEGCGFDILFCGGRLYGKWPQGTPYRDKGHRAYFWSSTQHVENDTTNYGITRVFAIDRNQILRGTSMPEAAYSVRCIKE